MGEWEEDNLPSHFSQYRWQYFTGTEIKGTYSSASRTMPKVKLTLY